MPTASLEMLLSPITLAHGPSRDLLKLTLTPTLDMDTLLATTWMVLDTTETLAMLPPLDSIPWARGPLTVTLMLRTMTTLLLSLTMLLPIPILLRHLTLLPGLTDIPPLLLLSTLQ